LIRAAALEIPAESPSSSRQLPITEFAHKTGVVGDLCIGALLVLAARDMTAERCGAAGLDRRHHLELAEAHMAGIGLAPCRSMAAEDIRNLQLWSCHPRRALGGRLVFLDMQRREAIERAHDLANGIGGNTGIERRRLEFGVPKRPCFIMRTFLCH
jgi:hypothetical protein